MFHTITLQDIKSKGSKALPDDRPVYLIVNSKPKSVIVPVAMYESMVEVLEDLEDAKVIEERKGEGTVKNIGR